MNLAEKLIENNEKMPNKVCLIQGNRKLTYRGLYKKVAFFRDYLEKQKIGMDSKVLVLIPMSIELYVTLIACWSIGAVPCFMDAGFIKNGMLKNDFNEIDAVIGTTKYIIYSNINKNLKKLKLKINSNIINKLEDVRPKLKVAKLQKDFPGIITYTSGTTGKPKIAARTHEFLNCQAEILKETINYESKDIELSSIPIFTLSNINAGITTVISDSNFVNLGKSNAKKLVEQIQKRKVNRLMAAPGLLHIISEYCLENCIQLNKIQKIYTGGGAVFLDLIHDLKIVCPKSNITTLYGSTEAEPIAELNIDDLSEKDIKATLNGKGILAGNIVGVKNCKLIKTNKKEFGEISRSDFKAMQTSKPGEIGEIVVSGDNVLSGYLNGIGDSENKISVRGTIYHRTGDLGLFDEKGRLWLRGRIKEPYFNIEAALHAKFDIGKTAIFKYKGKIILVLEDDFYIPENEIKKAINFEKINEIIYVRKIPVDKRHSTKVDYNALRKKLKME